MEQAIFSLSFTTTDQAGRSVRCLREEQALEIARRHHGTLRGVYRETLKNNIIPYRYVRNRTILSAKEQLRLLESDVAVVGAGGLGGLVLEILARTGIGRIIVVDDDILEETNLNRQVLSSKDTLGQSKTETGASRVRAVNPAVDMALYRKKINEDNGKELLAGAAVIVDALDTIGDRLALERTARALNIPLVHGAVAGFEGHVMTVFPEDQGLVLLYGETSLPESEKQNAEAVLGVPAATPFVIAALQAMEVVKIILQRGDPLRNRMLHADLETGRFNEFSFPERTGQ